MKLLFGTLLLIFATFSVATASTTYPGKITRIQAEGDGEPYNTVYLNYDVTDSACTSTNSLNRFTLTSDFQKSVALAAMLADKNVTIATDGQCRSNIEGINNIVIIR